MTDDEGAGDLQERLRALQRRAFAPDGDAAGDQAVARAMVELRAAIEAERAAGTDAPGSHAGRSGRPPFGAAVDVGQGPHGTVDPPRPAGVPPVAVAGTLRAGVVGAAVVDAGGPPRRRMLLASGLVGALLLGGLLGGTASRAMAPAAPAPVPSDDSASAVGEPVLATTVFRRLQTPKDIPLVAMPDAFVAASFRYLGSAGWTDADDDGVTDSPYYAVRSTADLICLVVVPEGSGYLSTCAPESAYPAAGLRLSWQSADLHPGVPDGTAGMVLDVTVAWLSDSTVETRGTGRPLPP